MRKVISMVLVIMMLFTLIPINNSYGVDGAIDNGVVYIKSVYGGMTISEKSIPIWSDYETINFSTVVPNNKYAINNVKHDIKLTYRDTK